MSARTSSKGTITRRPTVQPELRLHLATGIGAAFAVVLTVPAGWVCPAGIGDNLPVIPALRRRWRRSCATGAFSVKQ
ncbi:hypothetical protein GCM10010307_82140 [Streptomyces vastus]|uniref:Uncharacterized protein n=1 Tax=Streptomyces vastus TaxID=285451 RepID=A0ABN3RWW8_9ACTN